MSRLAILLLGAFLAASQAGAESLIDESLREFEELRLRQLAALQAGQQAAAFSTDGCSGNLSHGWRLLAERLPGFADGFGASPPWEHCCVAHDRHYWRGAAVGGFDARLRADRQLRQCVLLTGDDLAPQLRQKYDLDAAQVRELFDLIAELMYRAVRFGGQPCTMLPWRWGYGWPNCAFAPANEKPAADPDTGTNFGSE